MLYKFCFAVKVKSIGDWVMCFRAEEAKPVYLLPKAPILTSAKKKCSIKPEKEGSCHCLWRNYL